MASSVPARGCGRGSAEPLPGAHERFPTMAADTTTMIAASHPGMVLSGPGFMISMSSLSKRFGL